MIEVTVLYFAVLRERKGVASQTVRVPRDSTLHEIYTQLFPPGPEGILPVGFARNQHHASGDERARDGDEIALLPPLGGG